MDDFRAAAVAAASSIYSRGKIPSGDFGVVSDSGGRGGNAVGGTSVSSSSSSVAAAARRSRSRRSRLSVGSNSPPSSLGVTTVTLDDGGGGGFDHVDDEVYGLGGRRARQAQLGGEPDGGSEDNGDKDDDDDEDAGDPFLRTSAGLIKGTRHGKAEPPGGRGRGGGGRGREGGEGRGGRGGERGGRRVREGLRGRGEGGRGGGGGGGRGGGGGESAADGTAREEPITFGCISHGGSRGREVGCEAMLTRLVDDMTRQLRAINVGEMRVNSRDDLARLRDEVRSGTHPSDVVLWLCAACRAHFFCCLGSGGDRFIHKPKKYPQYIWQLLRVSESEVKNTQFSNRRRRDHNYRLPRMTGESRVAVKGAIA